MKILIADDNDVSRKLLRDLLAGFNQEVAQARDGEQAWQMIQSDPPEVLMTDWDMPWPDGLELCRRVRAREELHTYLLIMSGVYTLKAHYRAALEAGVDDVLNKPYEPQDIAVRLKVAERVIAFQKEIRELRGLLPVCGQCGAAVEGADYRRRLDAYVKLLGAGGRGLARCTTCGSPPS
jgi:phosphoserine phosphatase RsbU/P